MDAAVAHSAPLPAGIGGGASASSSGRPLDEARQHYMDVQQHAAAVQLLNRGLAVAHLRAELAMPRGSAVAVPRRQAIKHEPGVPNGTHDHQSQQSQPLLPWQAPQQPAQTAATASDQQAIAIQVSSSAAALQLQQADQPQQQPPQQQQQEPAAPRRARLPRRHLMHRAPNPLAAARFAAGDEDAAGVDAAAGSGMGLLSHQPGAQQTAHAPLPRMVADPALAAQQLAGWVVLGPDGAPLQLEVAAGVGVAAAAVDGSDAAVQGMEGVQEGGGVPGGVPGGGSQQQQAGEDDLMDEEEWV